MPLLRGDSWFQPCEDSWDKANTPLRRRKGICPKACGDPHIDRVQARGRRMVKLRRNNANDGIEVVVEPHTAPEDGRITSKLLVPEAVTDHHGLCKSVGGVSRIKQAA